jgi:nitrate reductase NapD
MQDPQPATVSGVVVRCRPDDRDSVRAAVQALPWADTHQEDDDGRMIVTIEAQDVDQSSERLLLIQSLPRVLSAELSAYVIDDGRD